MIPINRHPSPRELRQFAGLWFPAFWAMVGFLLYRQTGVLGLSLGIWAAAAVLGAVGLVRPAFIRRVYLGMVFAAYPIGWVVSHLLLGVIYYLLLTPLGLVLKLRGRDLLQRSPRSKEGTETSKRSYWHRRPAEPDPGRYFRQY